VVKLYVVRHGNAGSRSDWDGPDASRPLSEKGRRQADAVARHLERAGITRLLSSPAVRCMQTLEPLSRVIDVPIDEDKRLAEGSSGLDALDLVRELEVDHVALSSHGDVIPDLLDALHLRDAKQKGPVLWAKGSLWELKLDGLRIAKARYIAPPG
jgi:8-oxo-dGTP diphosphatase